MKFLISCIFIVIDFISGIIKGVREKNFNSSVMREGLFHKCGTLIILSVGYVIDYAQTYVDLGFTVPVSTTICVYIILMEITSIIENVGKINPKLLPNKIKEIFEKL